MSVTPVTDQSFAEEVLLAQGPVLVKFWAEWCAPCGALAPMVEKIADDPNINVKCVGVDISENTETPAKYGVRAVPTLAIFRGGELIVSHAGVQSESDLRAWVLGSIQEDSPGQ